MFLGYLGFLLATKKQVFKIEGDDSELARFQKYSNKI